MVIEMVIKIVLHSFKIIMFDLGTKKFLFQKRGNALAEYTSI